MNRAQIQAQQQQQDYRQLRTICERIGWQVKRLKDSVSADVRFTTPYGFIISSSEKVEHVAVPRVAYYLANGPSSMVARVGLPDGHIGTEHLNSVEAFSLALSWLLEEVPGSETTLTAIQDQG